MAQKSAPPITIQHVAIADLRPDPRNPRVMPELERDALDRSIDEFGLVEPVVVHRSTNRIVGGHRRVESAIRNGFVEVPVVFVDVTDEQADVLSLALNRIHGEWDNKLLARMLADLQNLPEVDISLTGFDDDEIKKQLRSLEARASGTASRPSTWTPHLNARSPDASNWARCGNSAKADSCVATPPIRLTLRHCWATRGRVWQSPTRRTTLHWETTAVARAASAADGSAMTNFRPNSGRPLSADLRPTCWRILTGRSTCFMSSKELPLVSRVLAEEGGHWSDTIIWEKDRFVLGRADYQRQYEPIWYGWREGVKHHWCGDRDQGDVWRIDRPQESELHPTMKPLALIERAIENSSEASDTVLDLFLGSGSMLIACERTGRSCYGMEIDPHYCAVAIACWESFTGQKAELDR